MDCWLLIAILIAVVFFIALWREIIRDYREESEQRRAALRRMKRDCPDQYEDWP
jgi:hypothetical protein